MAAPSHRRSLRKRRTLAVPAAVVAAGVGAGMYVMSANAGAVDLYHQTLPAKDGWAASGTGTTSGAKADSAHHNLWKGIVQRAPLARIGRIHVYDNVYDTTTADGYAPLYAGGTGGHHRRRRAEVTPARTGRAREVRLPGPASAVGVVSLPRRRSAPCTPPGPRRSAWRRGPGGP
ncbi:pectate lyase family protein [Streptomyces barringtoniae]|uniref:pectate lyase family protein n=1 Tax=Streptomyces barringtoniae TaxID=2892029 RepID=UPI001E3810BE|nr:hypothetical protein [Streptomyces barringtoniae]MCC5477089.1 hypothetical protein [Streptomyces barringtoniae]